MTARVFVDTNILVYCYDRLHPVKRSRAIDVVDKIARTRSGLHGAFLVMGMIVVVFVGLCLGFLVRSRMKNMGTT